MKGRTVRRLAVRALTAVAAGVLVHLLGSGCSLGSGQGAVSGTLNVPSCWSGKFDLQPDFFAAVPYRDTLDIRVQSGGDYETFSDGISILVDNVHAVRGDGSFAPGLLHTAIPVSLPPNVVPPGVPITPIANPALVHITLFLQRTCHTQGAALYAVDRVSLNASGTCDPQDGGLLSIQCGQATSGADASAPDAASPDASLPEAGTEAGADGGSSEAGVSPILPTASSTITFDSLFNGNPDETDADQRHTVVPFFDIYLADPRDGCPGGLGPPPPCRGHLTGHFDFYFQRGRPAQPFP